MSVQDFSQTAASNTNSSYFPENQLPSTVNNAARQLMADVAAMYRDQGWREYGDGTGSGDGTASYTATYASATAVTFAGIDTTGIYVAGSLVRAKVDAGSYIYGLVVSSSFSTDTTVTFAWFSGSLTSGTIRLWLGEHPVTNQNIPVAAVRETLQTPSVSSGTLAFSVTSGTLVRATLAENVTTLTVTWPAGVSSFTFEIIQDGTGSRTVAWPAGWAWSGGTEGQVSTTAGAVDVFTVYSTDGGATVRAFQAGLAMS